MIETEVYCTIALVIRRFACLRVKRRIVIIDRLACTRAKFHCLCGYIIDIVPGKRRETVIVAIIRINIRIISSDIADVPCDINTCAAAPISIQRTVENKLS